MITVTIDRVSGECLFNCHRCGHHQIYNIDTEPSPIICRMCKKRLIYIPENLMNSKMVTYYYHLFSKEE